MCELVFGGQKVAGRRDSRNLAFIFSCLTVQISSLTWGSVMQLVVLANSPDDDVAPFDDFVMTRGRISPPPDMSLSTEGIQSLTNKFTASLNVWQDKDWRVPKKPNT